MQQHMNLQLPLSNAMKAASACTTRHCNGGLRAARGYEKKTELNLQPAEQMSVVRLVREHILGLCLLCGQFEIYKDQYYTNRQWQHL